MLNTNINELKFVVFDLETTGLSPLENQIIEIAGRKINDKGDTIDVFHRFIKLYKVKTIDPFIVNLTKIDEELLSIKGEDNYEVMMDFLDFIDDSILVAQNSKFDMGFLVNYYLIENDIPFGRMCFDTINLSKYLFPNEKSYKLSELVKLFNVNYDKDAHHRADYDVLITSKVLIEIFKQLNQREIYILNELLECENFKKYSEKQESFLNSLMGKSGHFFHEKDFFNVTIASKHIDYYLKK